MCVEKENDVLHGRRGISVKIGIGIPGTVLLYYRTAGKVRVQMPGELWSRVEQCYYKKAVPQRVRKQLHNVVIVV